MCLTNVILAAICFASLTFMVVVYIHHSVADSDHTNHKDAKSISHPLLEQYHVLSESVAEKREELRNAYLLALQQPKGGGESPDRDGPDAIVTEESPRNFLKPPLVKSKEHASPPTYHDSSSSQVVENVGKSSSSGGYDLPGAGDHRIRTLSDESFESTPVSEMMSW